MVGFAFLLLVGSTHPAGPYTIVVPEGWEVTGGEAEGTSFWQAVSPEGDTVAVSHAEIPGMGILGRFIDEKGYMDKYAKGDAPKGCQKPPEKVSVGSHTVLVYSCEKNIVTAVCAPDMKAILTLVGTGPHAKEAVLQILEASFGE